MAADWYDAILKHNSTSGRCDDNGGANNRSYVGVVSESCDVVWMSPLVDCSLVPHGGEVAGSWLVSLAAPVYICDVNNFATFKYDVITLFTYLLTYNKGLFLFET